MHDLPEWGWEVEVAEVQGGTDRCEESLLHDGDAPY